MTDILHIPCTQCSAVNKLPREKIGVGAKCGRCKQALFGSDPGTLTAGNAKSQLGWTELPVVIDCWADWCGPCKQFGPVFEQSARNLDQRARFLKLNVEAEQALAQRFTIHSIPTVLVLNQNQEVARQSGAMSAGQFDAWLKRVLDGRAVDADEQGDQDDQ